MKNRNKIALAFIITAFTMISCLDDKPLAFEVEKPLSLVEREYLNSYDALKSYINRSANPNFKLGAATTHADFFGMGVRHRLLASNFNEITLQNDMKHESVVQANGTMNLANPANSVALAQRLGIDVFGHTLIWHAQQRGTYLRELIAPIPFPDEKMWVELITNGDFANDNLTTSFFFANAPTEILPEGSGPGGVGRALKITNTEVRPEVWGSQYWVRFAPPMLAGEQYKFTMSFRSDVNVSYSSQYHRAPQNYLSNGQLGNINSTTEWQTRTWDPLTSQAECASFAFNLGATATSYYIANVSLQKEVMRQDERPHEEKVEIITSEMERWIEGIMRVTQGVSSWNVVNEPLSDTPPHNVRTGPANPANNQFFWQDILGSVDYAVKAFEFAREYASPGAKLFISDVNLERFPAKVDALIAYVGDIEAKGVSVDGIGTHMRINTNTDRDGIVTMFQKLAASGKLIRVTELEVAIGNNVVIANATPEQYIQQADLYKFVVEKYFEIIPAAQRAGITVWSPLDGATSPVGLWTGTGSLLRKHSFAGFADGLAGRVVVPRQ